MKRMLFIGIITLIITSCWIEPKYGDYKIEGDTFYFEDMDTMCQILPAEINKTFTSWHWSGKKLKQKYNYYLNNDDYKVVFNDELYNKLIATDYEFIVKTGTSQKTVKYLDKNNKEHAIQNTYFLIIRRNKEIVVFFET